MLLADETKTIDQPRGLPTLPRRDPATDSPAGAIPPQARPGIVVVALTILTLAQDGARGADGTPRPARPPAGRRGRLGAPGDGVRPAARPVLAENASAGLMRRAGRYGVGHPGPAPRRSVP